MSDELLEQMNDTDIIKGSIAVWHLGQEGVAVKGSAQQVLYFDPYLSNYIEEMDGLRRNFPIPLDPSRITNADLVFISHHHLDHLDPKTIGPLAKASPQSKFIVPAPHVSILYELGISGERIIPAKANEQLQINGIIIYPFAGKHEEFEVDQNGDHSYLGYIVEINNICFYHAGDTLVYPELIQQLKHREIDIAYLPINGRDYFRNKKEIIGNMNFREAIELVAEIKVDTMIPCHYDLFDMNFENPSYFVDYLYRYYPRQKFKMLVPGERFYYLK
jgi:L-ascorbate 6-phosphate lactonase